MASLEHALPRGGVREEDLNGDGGVFMRLRQRGQSCQVVKDFSYVTVKYSGSLVLSGEEFDSSERFSFTLGRGEVLAGFEEAVRRLHVGDAAEVKIRHDYGYGETGLPGKIAPCAALFFHIELLCVEDEAPPSDSGLSEPLALPPSDGQAATLVVGGSPVKLDHLGPIVINTDGSTSRIANWSQMAPQEQANTARLIARRNKKRTGQ